MLRQYDMEDRINDIDKGGYSALKNAVVFRHTEVVKTLLAYPGIWVSNYSVREHSMYKCMEFGRYKRGYFFQDEYSLSERGEGEVRAFIEYFGKSTHVFLCISNGAFH